MLLRSKILFYLLLSLISIIGTSLVLYSTAWGPGLISDSFQYISSARNLASGNGLGYTIGKNIMPLVHYPPLYALVLSPFERVGIDTIQGARGLNAILLGVNAFLVGISIYLVTKSQGFSLLGAFLMAIQAAMIGVHSWALSEPLYLFFLILSFLFLGVWLEVKPNRQSRTGFVLSACCAGLAMLTRYVGVTVLFTGMLGIALFSKIDWKRKTFELLTWSAIVTLPICLWLLRNYVLANSFTGRSVGIHLLTRKNLGVFTNQVLTWFLPSSLVNGREVILLVAFALILVGLLVFSVLVYSRAGSGARRAFLVRLSSYHPIFYLQLFYIPVYVGFVFLSKSFFDEGTGMSDRILAPLYVSLSITIVVLLQQAWAARNLFVRGALLLTCFYVVIFTSFGAATAVRQLHQDGPGGAKERITSQSFTYLRSVEEVPIYSNSPSSIYLRTGNPGYSMGRFTRNYRAGTLEPGAVLVIFKHVVTNQDLPAVQAGDLTLLIDDPVATIYVYQP